jgi:hypothetical protein
MATNRSEVVVLVVHNNMGEGCDVRVVWSCEVWMCRCESVGMCRCPVGLDWSRVSACGSAPGSHQTIQKVKDG